MNVMILGGKPNGTAYPACPAGSELMERIGRIEACLDRLEQALALADLALDGKIPQPCGKTASGVAAPAPKKRSGGGAVPATRERTATGAFAPAPRPKTPPASESAGKGGPARRKTGKAGAAGKSSATA